MIFYSVVNKMLKAISIQDSKDGKGIYVEWHNSAEQDFPLTE